MGCASGTLLAGISAKASAPQRHSADRNSDDAAVYVLAKVTGSGRYTSMSSPPRVSDQPGWGDAFEGYRSGVPIRRQSAASGSYSYGWSVVSGALPAGATAKASKASHLTRRERNATTAAIYSPVVR
jgi:hypothetical protein